MKRNTTVRAFTLIELMIVISIIGVLAGLAVPTYRTYREKADTALAIAGGRQITHAIIAEASNPNSSGSSLETLSDVAALLNRNQSSLSQSTLKVMIGDKLLEQIRLSRRCLKCFINPSTGRRVCRLVDCNLPIIIWPPIGPWPPRVDATDVQIDIPLYGIVREQEIDRLYLRLDSTEGPHVGTRVELDSQLDIES